MKKVVLSLVSFALFLLFSAVWAKYDLTQKDIEDTHEITEKVIKIMNDKELDPIDIVTRVNRLALTVKYSDKQRAVFGLIAEELSLHFNLADKDKKYNEFISKYKMKIKWEKDNAIFWRYIVDGDRLIRIQGWVTNKDEEVWNFVIKMVPFNFREEIIEYHITNNPNSTATAEVLQLDNLNGWWLRVNLANLYQDEMLDKKWIAHTLINSIGHIAALWNSEIKYITPYDDVEKFIENCNNNFIKQWCLKKSSMLNSFINKFWPKEDFYNWVLLNVQGYSPSIFVSEEAVFNPIEDFSESFVYFVLWEKPSGVTIRDKKILFFYNFPDAVKLKKAIRTWLK